VHEHDDDLGDPLRGPDGGQVWCRLIAFASPGRVVVATQDEASSATCDTPMIAIFTPLMVVT